MTTDFLSSSQVKDFDYVIVGGGTAGCVIASRLSEYLPHKKILMIEAGPSDFNNEKVLKLKEWLTLLGGDLDYDYGTVEQPNGKKSNPKYAEYVLTSSRKLTYQTLSSQSARWLFITQHLDLIQTIRI